MSEVPSLIAKLKSEGIFIFLDGKALRVESGNGPIEDGIRQVLKNNKPEIIRYLKDDSPKPYFNSQGDLMIPFSCDPKYQWWVDGQSIRETKEEIRRNLVN